MPDVNKIRLASHVSLAAFAVVAAALSAAALFHERSATGDAIIDSADLTYPASSAQAAPVESFNTPPQSTPTVTQSTSGDSIVVIGDEHSSVSNTQGWVNSVAEDLHWDSVIILSSPGSGYITSPATCDSTSCSNFPDTIALAVNHDPDMIITFGGAADGDQDLASATAKYFAALHQAAPDAKLVAISPVTPADATPYWLGMHNRTIRAGVEAVGGTFIDVGQPGLGDGDGLSPESQAEIAKAITQALS